MNQSTRPTSPSPWKGESHEAAANANVCGTPQTPTGVPTAPDVGRVSFNHPGFDPGYNAEEARRKADAYKVEALEQKILEQKATINRLRWEIAFLNLEGKHRGI